MLEKWSGPDGAALLWDFLLSRFSLSAKMGVSRSEKFKNAAGRSETIIAGHAHGVLRLDEAGGVKIIQVPNPWGSGQEWGGRFADDDPVWNSMGEAEKTRLGYSISKNGTWRMPYDDFLLNFDSISMCRMVGEWKGPTAGGSGLAHLCPQFHLHFEEDSNVGIDLRQSSKHQSHVGQSL